jgi:hypothetical protein
MEIRRGASRTVLLTRRYAIKLPSLRSYRATLWGLLSNLAERERAGGPGLCPILWSLPGGLVVVMPRCERAPVDLIPSTEHRGDPDGAKADSWGVYQGQIVRVDYHGAV